MLITLSVIIGIETIVLFVIALKFTVMRGIIAHHDSQMQQLSENHARELQARIEADNNLLKQQADNAAAAAKKQEEATQLALSRQQAAFEEAKQILNSQYEKQLKQQQEDAIQDAKTQAESYERALKAKDERFQQAQEEAAKNLQTQVDAYERAIKEKNDLLEANSAKAEKASKELTENYERRLEQQEADFDKAQTALAERWQKELAALREEFQNSAGKMLEERTVKLDASNQKQMEVLLTPVKERLKELQEALATSQKERASLKTTVEEQVKAVKLNADRMTSEADKLTNALRGTNKLQGNWGELQLEQALVDCGLIKGVNFVMQTAITDASGRTFLTSSKGEHCIPDATVMFPDGRRIFIDSKVSLSAYLDYVEANDEQGKATALKEHLASVKNHIKTLGEKKYHEVGNKAIPNSSFDWTILFMGNEGALALALGAEPGLWEDAFKNQKVILVSRMSLYPLLWLIQMAWQFEKQSKNQADILENTRKLIERLENFVSVFEKIGAKLSDAQKAFVASRHTLCEGSQCVIRTGQRVAEGMGKESKKLKDFEDKCQQSLEAADASDNT